MPVVPPYFQITAWFLPHLFTKETYLEDIVYVLLPVAVTVSIQIFLTDTPDRP